MTQDDTNNQFERRQADRKTKRLQRNLNWGQLPSDIDLFDHSPSLLSDALESVDGELRLTPGVHQDKEQSEDDDTTAESSENVTSLQSIRSLKTDAAQHHLLTRYTAEALSERCKQISMQQALIRKRGEQRLYLAVGMVHWIPDESDAQINCSPLLFYPMQLLTEENTRSESGYIHSIKNDCEHPEFNYQLTSALRKRFKVTLPVLKSTQSLNDFLDLIDSTIAAVPELVLHRSVALGVARSPAGIATENKSDNLALRSLPAEFDAALAYQLIDGQDMSSLRSTLRLLKQSNERELIGNDDPGDLSQTPDINQVRKFSEVLDQHGLGKVKFQDLPELPEMIQEWIESVEPLHTSDLMTRCLQQEKIDAVPMLKLTGLVELLDKAPSQIEPLMHADLAYRGTPFLFKRAKYQARLIEEEVSQLKEHFHLDRVPPKHQLLQLLDELGGVENNAIEVVDSDYFHARRRFMELSIEKPTTLTDLHRQQLNKLVKVLRFRELFVNNSEYRLALGPAYRGLKTDWTVLEGVIEYAQEISTYIGNEAVAAQILGDWKNFRNTFMANLDQLQVAGRGLHKLLQIDKPYNPEISVQELLEHGRVLAGKLREWNLEYGLITNYGDKTPATLLSIFSGTAKQDKETESMVRNANRKLQEYLIKNQDAGALHRINATLTWLNDVVTDDSASAKEIEEVVRSTLQKVEPDEYIT